METNKNLKYTCIFGGGAIRGLAYIGALQAINELGIELTTLAGSSVGAIFAGLLAVGYTQDEIESIFMKVNYDLFKDIQLGKTFGISKGEIFLEWIQELLERKFYGSNYEKGKNTPIKFSDLKKNLVILTTNLANFRCKEFSNFTTPDAEVAYAIRISAGMPGLMPPIKASGAILVDGDLQKSWPLWKLSSNLCNQKDRILEFRLEGDFDVERQGNIDFVNTVYSCVTSVATKFIVDKYAQKDKFDYIVINTGPTLIVDFNLNEQKRKELINIGYKMSMDYFKTTLKDKKKYLIEYYTPLYHTIVNVYNLIEHKKYTDAKIALGDFYMKHIQTISKYIEKDYIFMLDAIKNLILNNYYINIFRKPKIKNPKIILSRLNILKQEVKTRLDELESYNVS